MVKIAICEKDSALSSALTEYTARYAEERGIECNALVFSTGKDLLEKPIEYDAAFISVGIDEGKGIEVAEKLHEISTTVPVVFIGTEKQFLIKGKRADAMDFLISPVTYYAYATMLDRIQVRLVETEVPTLALMTKQGARRVAVDQITYIESSANHVLYHMKNDEDLRVRGSLSDAEKKLTADRFFRLGGCLLNLEHVYKVSGNDVYVGETCLKLSPKKKAALLDNLLAFMNRG